MRRSTKQARSSGSAAIGGAATLAPPLAPLPEWCSLPDELLLACLAPLSANEWHSRAALVCKRWGELCCSRELNADLCIACGSRYAGMSPSQLAAVGEGEVTAQLARAATLVTCFGPRAAPPRHVAAHLRRLQLRLTFLPRLENWIGGDADAEAVLSAVLTAAGSGGQLQELSLHTTNLPHLAIGGWPVTMPRLRRLRIQLDGCDVSNAEWHPAVYVGAAASSLRSLQCLELGAGSLSRMDCAPSQVTRLAWQERWEHSEPGFDLAQISQRFTGLHSLSFRVPFEVHEALRELRSPQGCLAHLHLEEGVRLTYLQPAVAAGLRALHIKQDAQLYWAPAVAAALLHMTQLTAFALEGPPLSGCVMRALASLPRLQRLVQCGAQFAEGYELAYGTMKDIPAEEKLPTAGSELTWMRRLRWLGLDAGELRANSQLLNAACTGGRPLERLLIFGRPYDPYGAKLSWWQRFWKWLESDATPWQRCTLVVPADSLEEAGRQLADRRSRRSQVPRPDAVSYDEVWSGLVFSDWA